MLAEDFGPSWHGMEGTRVCKLAAASGGAFWQVDLSKVLVFLTKGF